MGAGCCGSKVQPQPQSQLEPQSQPRPKSFRPPVTPQYEIPKPESPPMRHEYFSMQRFNKVSISTSNPLTLIKGYFNEPLASLEEALEPFDGKIDQLFDYIREAKTQCHYPSQHNLTRDESAAIYIYTMRWGDRCLYDHLQVAWKSEDRAKLIPWFKYLKLFRTALNKLPNTNTEIWQGTAYDEKLREQLSSKLPILYSSMGSCCLSEKELKEYIEKHDGTKMILVGYESVNGKLVTNYTADNSKEVILWPGMKLSVAKYIVADTNGSLTFHLVGSIMKVPELIKPLITEKHFVCRNNYCNNRCRGNHDGNHCYGFAFLFHSCQHHCGPLQRCFLCDKQVASLRECNKCQSRYCESCCIK